MTTKIIKKRLRKKSDNKYSMLDEYTDTKGNESAKKKLRIDDLLSNIKNKKHDLDIFLSNEKEMDPFNILESDSEITEESDREKSEYEEDDGMYTEDDEFIISDNKENFPTTYKNPIFIIDDSDDSELNESVDLYTQETTDTRFEYDHEKWSDINMTTFVNITQRALGLIDDYIDNGIPYDIDEDVAESEVYPSFIKSMLVSCKSGWINKKKELNNWFMRLSDEEFDSIERICGDKSFLDKLYEIGMHKSIENMFFDKNFCLYIIQKTQNRQFNSKARETLDWMKVDTNRIEDILTAVYENRLRIGIPYKRVSSELDSATSYLNEVKVTDISSKGNMALIKQDEKIEKSFYHIMCDVCQKWKRKGNFRQTWKDQYICFENRYLFSVEKNEEDDEYGIKAPCRSSNKDGRLWLQACPKCYLMLTKIQKLVSIIRSWCIEMPPYWKIAEKMNNEIGKFYRCAIMTFLHEIGKFKNVY